MGYYRAIDSGVLDDVIGRFAEDACYERGGYPPILGAAGLREFYAEVRIIEEGEHLIDQVLVSGDNAAVTGTFSGRSRDGAVLQIGFADFFVFCRGLIQGRKTYFLIKGV